MFGKTFKILLLWSGVGQAIWGVVLGSWFWILIGVLVAVIGLVALAKEMGKKRSSFRRR